MDKQVRRSMLQQCYHCITHDKADGSIEKVYNIAEDGTGKEMSLPRLDADVRHMTDDILDIIPWTYTMPNIQVPDTNDDIIP